MLKIDKYFDILNLDTFIAYSTLDCLLYMQSMVEFEEQ